MNYKKRRLLSVLIVIILMVLIIKLCNKRHRLYAIEEKEELLKYDIALDIGRKDIVGIYICGWNSMPEDYIKQGTDFKNFYPYGYMGKSIDQIKIELGVLIELYKPKVIIAHSAGCVLSSMIDTSNVEEIHMLAPIDFSKLGVVTNVVKPVINIVPVSVYNFFAERLGKPYDSEVSNRFYNIREFQLNQFIEISKNVISKDAITYKMKNDRLPYEDKSYDFVLNADHRIDPKDINKLITQLSHRYNW